MVPQLSRSFPPLSSPPPPSLPLSPLPQAPRCGASSSSPCCWARAAGWSTSTRSTWCTATSSRPTSCCPQRRRSVQLLVHRKRQRASLAESPWESRAQQIFSALCTGASLRVFCTFDKPMMNLLIYVPFHPVCPTHQTPNPKQAKISDFGGVRNMESEATRVFGTEEYLDPDYVNTGKALPSADVYGCVRGEAVVSFSFPAVNLKACLSVVQRRPCPLSLCCNVELRVNELVALQSFSPQPVSYWAADTRSTTACLSLLCH